MPNPFLPKKKRKESLFSAAYGKIDTKGLEVLIASTIPFVLFDARFSSGDATSHHIPTAQFFSREEATPAQVKKRIPSKKTLIVVYCSNINCPMGSHLAHHLIGMGYRNILKYEEGIEEWIRTGHKVEKS